MIVQSRGRFLENVRQMLKQGRGYSSSLLCGGPKRSNLVFSGCRNSTGRSRHLSGQNAMSGRQPPPLLRFPSTLMERSSLARRSFFSSRKSPSLLLLRYKLVASFISFPTTLGFYSVLVVTLETLILVWGIKEDNLPGWFPPPDELLRAVSVSEMIERHNHPVNLKLHWRKYICFRSSPCVDNVEPFSQQC